MVYDDLELMRLAADECENFSGKSIPYLGWYWRDWTNGVVSLAENQVAIDQARKWDYPCARMSDVDFRTAKELLIQMGKAKQELLEILESYRDKVS